MVNIVKEYISNNFKKIIVFLSCILIGLVIGIIVYKFLDNNVKVELIKTLKSTLDYSKTNNFEGINVIKNGMISNSILIVIIYISAITLIAPTIICILNGFKGFAIGLYIPTLFEVFGVGNGILSLLLLVILPNIIYIPAYIYISVNALGFHYNIINNEYNRVKLIIKETYRLILGFSLISLSVILEQLLSIIVINIYKAM